MALLVEDGSGKSGAASWVTVAEARAYAAARGLSLPDDDATLEPLLVRATDYLETYRARFKGFRVNGRGYLSWPREGADLDGDAIPATEIPEQLKRAQAQVAVELQTTDVQADDGPAVREEQVGPIRTVYAVQDGARPKARWPKVDALLAPLLRPGGLTLERA